MVLGCTMQYEVLLNSKYTDYQYKLKGAKCLIGRYENFLVPMPFIIGSIGHSHVFRIDLTKDKLIGVYTY